MRLLARSTYLLRRLGSIHDVFDRDKVPAQPPLVLLPEVYNELDFLLRLLESTKQAAKETHRELATMWLEGSMDFYKEAMFAMGIVRGGPDARNVETEWEDDRIAVRDVAWFLERVQWGGKKVGVETIEVSEILTEVAASVEDLEDKVVVLPDDQTWEWWGATNGQDERGAMFLRDCGLPEQEEVAAPAEEAFDVDGSVY
jgi:hypothetical protein